MIRDLDYKLYEGHSEAVIGLVNVEAVLNNIGDQPRIYSVGQDSKIMYYIIFFFSFFLFSIYYFIYLFEIVLGIHMICQLY